MTETKEYPPGNYAIVELVGDTTLVGRVSHVEVCGTEMLAVEPLFADALLPVVFYGSGAIYRETPCSAEVAFARQPRHEYQLPQPFDAIAHSAMIVVTLKKLRADRDDDDDSEGPNYYDPNDYDDRDTDSNDDPTDT